MTREFGKLTEDELHLLAHIQTLETNLSHMRTDLFERVRTRLNVPYDATVQFRVMPDNTAYLEESDIG